jgi:hypothetical protein
METRYEYYKAYGRTLEAPVGPGYINEGYQDAWNYCRKEGIHRIGVHKRWLGNGAFTLITKAEARSRVSRLGFSLEADQRSETISTRDAP